MLPTCGCRNVIYTRLALSLLACLLVISCTSPTYPARTVPAPAPAPTQLEATKIYFYPTRGQSEEQQDKDRYECYLWAVKQSGFDPSVAQLAPHQRVEVVPEPPPGTGTAAGAVTGAIAGSILAGHGSREEGAILGAIAGAMIGTAADASRQAQAEKMTEQVNYEKYARVDMLARDYRRAMTACLEGKGYVVR
ncbi:glycine zipper 2TM domain-containing protein [Haliea sp. E17]|uniref:glycine zipper 2TM domain-containing protein n=1 Tax=Haliea sp. E17 TaxID=3401576 RepID=UPI003AB00758